MKTEKTFAILFILGLIFKMNHLPGASLLIIISLFIISILYFPAAFYFFCDKSIKTQNLPLSIGVGFIFSIIPIGLIFKLQYWPGANIYLLFGSISSIIVSVLIYYLKSKSTTELMKYYKNMFTRSLILSFLAITFYIISTDTLIKIQYADNPKLARLKILHYTNPTNKEYQKQHDAYLNSPERLNKLYNK